MPCYIIPGTWRGCTGSILSWHTDQASSMANLRLTSSDSKPGLDVLGTELTVFPCLSPSHPDCSDSGLVERLGDRINGPFSTLLFSNLKISRPDKYLHHENSYLLEILISESKTNYFEYCVLELRQNWSILMEVWLLRNGFLWWTDTS